MLTARCVTLLRFATPIGSTEPNDLRSHWLGRLRTCAWRSWVVGCRRGPARFDQRQPLPRLAVRFSVRSASPQWAACPNGLAADLPASPARLHRLAERALRSGPFNRLRRAPLLRFGSLQHLPATPRCPQLPAWRTIPLRHCDPGRANGKEGYGNRFPAAAGRIVALAVFRSRPRCPAAAVGRQPMDAARRGSCIAASFQAMSRYPPGRALVAWSGFSAPTALLGFWALRSLAPASGWPSCFQPPHPTCRYPPRPPRLSIFASGRPSSSNS